MTHTGDPPILISIMTEADALERHCRQRLAASCYGLAVKLAGEALRLRKWPNGLDPDDVYAEALLGPVAASKTYTPGLGAKFATYAYNAILFRIRSLHGNESRRAGKRLWGQFRQTRHVWHPDAGAGAVTPMDYLLTDHRAGPEELAEAADEDARRRAEMQAILSRITNDNRRAIAWRHYGLGEEQKAIARDVRLSRQRVNQLCLMALAEMRGEPWPPGRDLSADARRAAAMYAAGVPMASITRRFGVSEKTVQRWREAAGVKVRPGGRPRKGALNHGA